MSLAYQVGKVGVTLREESQHRHFLRSKLILVWDGSIKYMIEPLQAVTAQLPSIFKSAMLVGDVVRIDDHTMHPTHCATINLPETLYHYFSKMLCFLAACIVMRALLQERF